jgi:hypothetical protein
LGGTKPAIGVAIQTARTAKSVAPLCRSGTVEAHTIRKIGRFRKALAAKAGRRDLCAAHTSRGPCGREHTRMIWFYEREGRHLRFEIRAHVEGDRYDLVITDADGMERVERFVDSSLLNRRSRQLELELRGEGWKGPHSRD